MTAQNIIKYIEDPTILDDNSIIDLTLLTEQYPYFQAGQLLRVKNLYLLSPQTIKPVLNFTAAYVTDRKILYYLLHPIQDKPVIEKSKSHEKQIKDTIRENISDTLETQKQLAEIITTGEIEFTTSFDLFKEYGQGVELDEFVVRINNTESEVLELFDNEPEKISAESTQNINHSEDLSKKEKRKSLNPNDDILTIINKGIGFEELEKYETEIPAQKLKQVSLIDNFLKTNPKIVPVKPGEVPIKDISEDSVKEHDHLITDTLADIYLKQGNYAKAIFAYEKLSLKYPEKSTYFAAQIAEIKKLIDNTK
jgi:tetratricopeptide (TPR) repeat protein